MAVKPLVVNFGGGVNSTAMLCGLYERREQVSMVVFADTGGERPDVYEHVKRMSDWCSARGMPAIEVVRWIRQDGSFISLEENCLQKKELPSLAYGFKGCSVKWKAQPIDKAVKARFGINCIRCIGFDAGESHRVKPRPESPWEFRYPLVEWGWDRQECLLAIKRVGAPKAAKSACFFCPASKKWEIKELKERSPDLYERAIAMERNAETRTVKGLGRRWSWEEAMRSEGPDLFSSEIACECYEGPEDHPTQEADE